MGPPPRARWERARAEPAGAALPTNRLRTNKYRLQYLPPKDIQARDALQQLLFVQLGS